MMEYEHPFALGTSQGAQIWARTRGGENEMYVRSETPALNSSTILNTRQSLSITTIDPASSSTPFKPGADSESASLHPSKF